MICIDFQKVVAKQVTIWFSGSIESLNPVLLVPCSKNASVRNCVMLPTKAYVEILTPAPQNLTLFRKRSLQM